MMIFTSLRMALFFKNSLHTWKVTAGSPKKHQIEKENHLNQTTSIFGIKILIFQGCMVCLFFSGDAYILNLPLLKK